jgi:hypothetical protein
VQGSRRFARNRSPLAQGRNHAVVSDLGKTSTGGEGEIVIDKIIGFFMGVAVWLLLAFVFGVLARPVYELFQAGWGVWG